VVRSRPELISPGSSSPPQKPLEPSGSGGFSLFWRARLFRPWRCSPKLGVSAWPPELSDPVGPVEVGEHQDVEQFGAGSRPGGVEALT